jgi:hypothetical protein
MVEHDLILKALKELRPLAEFTLRGTELEWLDSKQPEPSQDEINTEIERQKKEFTDNQYQRDRLKKYPNTDDLIVALWEKVIEGRSESSDALEVKRQEVKTANPKSE